MIKKFVSYYKPHKALFFTDMVCALLIAICNIVYPIITRNFMNKFVPNSNMRMIIISVAILFFIYLAKAGLTYFVDYWGHVMGVRIQCDIRQDAFNHLQKLPFSYFDRARSGSIMSRIINDTMDISELAHHGPEDLFISIITLVGSFAYLSGVNLKLTLIIFAFIPLLVIFLAIKRKKLARTSMESRKKIGEVNADLENSIAGVRVSKAYDSSDQEVKKFKKGNYAFAKAKSTQYQAMGEYFAGNGLIVDILTLISLFSSGVFAYNKWITLGDFTGFLLFVGLFTDPIKKLINFTEQLQSGITGFQRIDELISEPIEGENPNAKELALVNGNILFDNITFKYNDQDDVFSNLTLQIERGQTVALVGPSGGGKSTLCHLLPRFYEIEAGKILLDGVNINDYTRLSLRENIGIVQQDTFLFTGTIKDNIAYGDFSATDEEIIKAAALANIHEFVDGLPDKYDTFVGERGTMLSGGQKQRISIARIFLKNPPILILDEATSALDNTTELAIQTALDHLAKGRTTMVVAHRLSTIMNADNIVYIANGKIMEQGSHSQLLEKGGHYATLWNAQTKCSI